MQSDASLFCLLKRALSIFRTRYGFRGLFLLLWATLLLGPHPFAAVVEREGYRTEHFDFLIDKSKAGSLPFIASQFEFSYERLTRHFDFKPEKRIQVLLMDEDDFSNGYAFSAQGWVVVFLPTSEIHLRGKTPWLPNVISHELAHVVTLRKMGDISRFLGLQLSTVLLFDPGQSLEAGLSFAWYNTPAWFAEGLAQYGSQICGHDTVDAVRLAVIKTAHASRSLLTLPEMTAFGWDGRRNEMIYTQGFFLTSYLFNQYGQAAMNRLLAEMRRSSFEAAFRKVLGKGLGDLYGDWTLHLDSTWTFPRDTLHTKPWTLPKASESYVMQSIPVRGADGRSFFLSSHRNAYGITDLYAKHGTELEMIHRRAEGPLAASPDGRHIYFTHLSVSWKSGRLVRDLYRYDVADNAVKRMTRNARVTSVAVDTQGDIFVLAEKGGKVRLARWDQDSLVRIAEYPMSMNLANLAGGDSAGRLLAERITGRGADIVTLQSSNGRVETVLATRFDEKEPRWNARDSSLLFSADYSGIHQIYTLKGGILTQWTQGQASHSQPGWQTGALFCKRYDEAGFLVDSLPEAELKPVTRMLDSLGVGSPFETAKALTPQGPKWGNDGLRFLGYSLFARIVEKPEQRNLFGTDDTQSPLFNIDRPDGVFSWTAGLEGIWMHPGEESQLFAHAGLSDEMTGAVEDNPFLSEVQLAYMNRALGPTFIGQFASATERFAQCATPEKQFDYTLLQALMALEFPFNNDFSALAFGQFTGVRLKTSDTFLFTDFNGGGALYGAALQYAAYQPGVNFPNQLAMLQVGLSLAPLYVSDGVFAQWNALRLSTHSWHTLFYDLSVQSQTLGTEEYSTSLDAMGSVSLDWPTRWSCRLGQDAQLFLSNVLPSLGLAYAFEPHPGDIVQTDALSSLRRLPIAFNRHGRQAAGPDVGFASSRNHMHALASLTFKMITPLRNLAYWNFFYSYPLTQGGREPTFGAQIAL
jgi:hypothetical protein